MDANHIIESYLTWIRDNTFAKSIQEDKIFSVSTPYLDRHNDHLEIYVQKRNGIIVLTDDGYTISDLRMSGFEINTPKRIRILETTLRGFGVQLNEAGAIYIEATPQNIGQKKHSLLQALLAVNDMYNLAQETVFSLFKEDVEQYLYENDIYFSKDIKITGRSGFDHNIDFLIPGSKTRPERLVRTINNPKKDTILSSIMAFSDIVETRDTKPKNFVIYNDAEKKVVNDVVSALDNYGIEHIAWSQRDRCLSEFSLN